MTETRSVDAGPAPANSVDAIIEVYRAELDLSLIGESLKLSPQQRIERLMALQRVHDELRRAGDRLRAK